MPEGTHKPPHAPRIALTREAADNAWLAQQLTALGAQPLSCPLLQVALLDPAAVALQRGHYDWLAATSRRALAWLDWRLGLANAPRFDQCACVGTATAQYARAVLKLEPLVATPHTAKALAAAMAVAPGDTVLFLRGNLAREDLPALLRKSGADVDDPVVYETRADATGVARLKALVAQGELDAVVLASPSAVDFALAGQVPLASLACFSMGPSTTDALKAAGIAPQAQAEPHSAQGLLQAIMKWKQA